VTTWLERVSTEEITRQAREIHPARTVLTWLAGLLFGLGWVAYKTVAVGWLVCAWSFVAVREGWREAGKSRVSRGAGRPG